MRWLEIISASAAASGCIPSPWGASCGSSRSVPNPLRRTYQQDAVVVECLLIAEYPKIRGLASQDQATPSFGDEASIHSNAHAGFT